MSHSWRPNFHGCLFNGCKAMSTALSSWVVSFRFRSKIVLMHKYLHSMFLPGLRCEAKSSLFCHWGVIVVFIDWPWHHLICHENLVLMWHMNVMHTAFVHDEWKVENPVTLVYKELENGCNYRKLLEGSTITLGSVDELAGAHIKRLRLTLHLPNPWHLDYESIMHKQLLLPTTTVSCWDHPITQFLINEDHSYFKCKSDLANAYPPRNGSRAPSRVKIVVNVSCSR